MKSNQSPLKRDFKDFALWNVYHEVKGSSALGFAWCVVARGCFHSQGRKDGTGPEGVPAHPREDELFLLWESFWTQLGIANYVQDLDPSCRDLQYKFCVCCGSLTAQLG